MSTAARRRVLAGLVGLAIGWPLLHHGLARWTAIDPWELFGIAMYTVPPPRVEVEVLVGMDGADRPLYTAGSLRRELAAFARRKSALGDWISEEDFARELLERQPDWEAVTLVVRRWRLDRATARLVVEPRRTRVERRTDVAAGSEGS